MPRKSPIDQLLAYESAKAAIGISDAKIALLLDLHRHGGSSYSDIVNRTRVNLKTLLRYVRDLRLSGHLARGTGDEELKTAVFSLAPAGSDLVASLLKHLER